MTSEPLTYTRAQASEVLCPTRDKPCVADRCAAFRWTSMKDHENKAPLGQCGLSTESC